MMSYLRKNVKTFLWAFAIVFIGGIFFLNYSAKRMPGYIAKVNGKRIPYRQFDFIVRHQLREQREKSEEEITEEQIKQVKQEVLGALVEEELIVQEAKNFGLKVSEKDVVRTIYSLPQFQNEGKFDPGLYNRILTHFYRIDPESYEKQVSRGLLIREMKRVVLDSIKLTTQEIKIEYLRRNGSLANFEKEKDDFVKSFLQEKQIALFNQWLMTIQRQAKIINNLPLYENIS